MHNLEHLLQILEQRIRKAGSLDELPELADAVGILGGASNGYDPRPFANPAPGKPGDSDEALAEINRDWSQRFLPPIPQMKKLYVMQNGEPDTLKIGTSYDPEARARGLQTGNHRTLTVVYTTTSEDGEREAEVWETRIKTILADRHIRGEWYRVTLDEAKQAIAQAKVTP